MPFETRNLIKKSGCKLKSKKIFTDLKKAKSEHFSEHTNTVILFCQNNKKKIIGFFIFLFIFLFLFLAIFFAYSYYQNNKQEILKNTLEIATNVLGKDLKKSEDNLTNILLLGAGGEDHEGGYLTDSLIVMTLNHNLRTVSMLSIPRDLYVRYTVEGRKRKGKINRVFMDAMNHWKFMEGKTNTKEMIELSAPIIEKEISEIIGQKIDYSFYIDFQGFVKVIDQLGGIEINVEKKIYDSSYPGPNFSYTIFKLDEGLQTLSGKTSLKYVRSRHGNAGGDFGRSYRQKKAIFALKEKAMSSGILTSPSQLKAILGIIDENFWTDMSWNELISFVNFIKDLNRDHISMAGIKDMASTAVTKNEWFLYTPPRDLFNGASVLLPCRINTNKPWSDISMYHNLLTQVPELVDKKNNIVSIYNTTKTGGIASVLEIVLNRFSINLSELGNAKNREKSVIEYKYDEEGRNEKIAYFLSDWLKIPVQEMPEISENSNTTSDKKTENIITLDEINSICVADNNENIDGNITDISCNNNEEYSDDKNNEKVVESKKDEKIYDINPSEINIYLGNDYIEEYRDEILWYRKCAY